MFRLFPLVGLSKEEKQELPSHLPLYPSSAEKQLIPVLGLSGSGVSTCVNYLAGCEYEPKENEETGAEYLQVKSGQIEHCKTIPEKGFVTFYPQVVTIPKGFNLLDCPAINYSGLEINMAASKVALQLAIQQAASIRGVVVTIRYQDFLDKSAGGIALTWKHLGDMFSQLSQQTDSVLFLITDAPEKITHVQIIAKIKEYASNDSIDEELREKMQLLYNVALNKPDNIILFKPLAKISQHPLILGKLSELKPISKKSITLCGDTKPSERLLNSIKKMNDQFVTLSKAKNQEISKEENSAIEKKSDQSKKTDFLKMEQYMDYTLIYTIGTAAQLDPKVMEAFANYFLDNRKIEVSSQRPFKAFSVSGE